MACLLWSAVDLGAQTPLVLSDAPDRYPLGLHVEILEDPTGRLSVSEARAQSGWQPSQHEVPNFSISNSTYWLRAQVTNPTEGERSLLLEVGQPLVDYLDFFVLKGTTLLVQRQTGDMRAAQSRAIESRHFLLPLRVPAGEHRSIYLRVATQDGLHDPLPIYLWRPNAFWKEDFHRTPPMAGLMLVVLIMAAYHFFVFLSLRDRSYLYYVLFLASLFVVISTHWGFASLTFLRPWPAAANWVHGPAQLTLIGCLLLFARGFLETTRTMPRIEPWLRVLQLLVWGGLLVCAISGYRVANLTAASVTILIIPILLFTGVSSLVSGHKPARFFLLAFATLLLGGTVRAAHMIGLIHAEVFSNLVLFVGVGGAAALLSLGLADRISTMRQEQESFARRTSVQLARQNEQLRRLDLLKDEFLANTSHELRTPLNGIIGITESMLEGATGNLPLDARRNLQLVSLSGRRLSRLVDDVLDFSRIQHGDLTLRQRPIDLQSVVNVVVELLRPLIADKPLTLAVDIADDLPLVHADEDRLQQILHNLLGNALKFTKKGSIVVSAQVLLSEPPVGEVPESVAQMAKVTVSDTGVGIPPGTEELIFESFRQADGSISREYGGTGLGLAITRQLVELHGGTIGVEKHEGPGTRISFLMPLFVEEKSGRSSPSPAAPAGPASTASAEPLASAEQTPPEAKTAPTVPSQNEIRALVVDDDPINLTVLENHLRLDGLFVASATNGRDALAMLDSSERFDVVLLDVMMPGLSGYEVCSIIRQTHSQSELPVIMLTAKNQVNDLETALDHGANDYLAKPFDPRELRARVRTMVALREAARAQSYMAAIHAELDLARGIQQSLIPARPPEVDGLKVGARYRAMASVGGDFYDMRPYENGLGVLMADVSGHGVPAALIVSMVQLAFWFQKESLTQPHMLCASMNEILYGNTGNEFVTACYLFIDPASGLLTTSNAGHPPLLVWRRAEQQILRLRPMGRLLGILPSVEYELSTVQLQKGDRVLIYTDGAFEAKSPEGEFFGPERLEQYLIEHQQVPAEALVDDLLTCLLQWSGGESRIEDDIAIIAIDIE